MKMREYILGKKKQSYNCHWKQIKVRKHSYNSRS